MKRHCLALLLTILLLPSPVGGQEPSSTAANDDYQRCVDALKDVASRLASNLDQRQWNPLASGNLVPTPTTSVALRSSSNGGRAEFSLARPSAAPNGGPMWTLKASAPFDKAEGEGIPISDQGVSGDFNLGTGLTWTHWDLDIDGYAESLCGRCRKEEIPVPDCRPEKFDDGEQLIDTLTGTFPLKKLGVELVGGQKNREYFETEGAVSSEDRVGYSVGLFGGLLIRRTWMLQGRGSWKRDFDEQDTAEICTSIEDSPLQTCKMKPLGRANEEEKLILSVQGIRYYSWSGLDRAVAFAPLVAYDFENDEPEIQLPLYLATNEDGDFTGGLRLVWRPDADDSDDEWQASVFVSKPLQIFQ